VDATSGEGARAAGVQGGAPPGQVEAMVDKLRQPVSAVGRRINPFYLADEGELLESALPRAETSPVAQQAVSRTAQRLVHAVRRDRRHKSGLDALLHQYELSSAEGVALMCLAEALLRVPDAPTADLLISDRLRSGAWAEHLHDSDSLFVNASTWALMLTGELLSPDPAAVNNPGGFLRQMMTRLGEPLVRAALRHAMAVIAEQFVMGRDIGEALARCRQAGASSYRYSFDMLGEAALSRGDAARYLAAYDGAIRRLGREWDASRDPPGISVKLSALHPRLELLQRDVVFKDLLSGLVDLARVARENGVAVTLDAEEAALLELQLMLLEAVLRSPALAGWDGMGVAVQAYQRRAFAVLDWLDDIACQTARRIPVRLVKGAYWDTEIKRAQEAGLCSYPVFTRKVNTDVAYLACARRVLQAGDRLVGQFATHNAHTVAWVMQEAAAAGTAFEFQRLHGMGEALYDEVVEGFGLPCRVYAPVGPQEELLPYLVRRLLENGANSSFVNRIVQDTVPVADIIGDPVLQARCLGTGPDPLLPEPAALFEPVRRNSAGLNLDDSLTWESLGSDMAVFLASQYQAEPLIDGRPAVGLDPVSVTGPAGGLPLGTVSMARVEQVGEAVSAALLAFPAWSRTDVRERSAILRRAADLVEAARAELVALCVREAGRCVADALDEVRETVDFLRYYAAQADLLLESARPLPGPTGEHNELRLRARGVFACISPWNFPMAIFTGQVAAALVTGNTVVAKPAEQTSLVAARMVQLLWKAGLPTGALQFLPGDGGGVGARLASDPRLAGVAFTGSTSTAQLIYEALGRNAGPGAVLIAETGGINVLVADSSALPEQLVRDAMRSAFNSAGQRCSALRILALQEEIAPRVIALLEGRMAELRIGDPADPATDVGPVIDEGACAALRAYRERMAAQGRVRYACALPGGLPTANFIAPCLVEISDISEVKDEIFGPVLHICQFPARDWERVLDAINASGFGLTSGLHSRIGRRVEEFASRVRAGNIYVNRNLVGAVVGVQPFGGCGRSGSGPKAGGPHYLLRFLAEQTVTINTAAIGGNVQLLSGRPA
jgi:RHH-type proline utilization regulon transcriptional repressor/proline dehydrogenase/delta 1-pyrroline-5-carboxylate dehydrogenase